MWLVGQYAAVSETDSTLGHTGIGFEGLSGVAYWAPDVLREIAKSFAGEVGVWRLICHFYDINL